MIEWRQVSSVCLAWVSFAVMAMSESAEIIFACRARALDQTAFASEMAERAYIGRDTSITELMGRPTD